MEKLTKMEVRLHLRSGRVLRFFAKTLTTNYDRSTGQLTKIDVEGQRGWPHFINLKEVSAVTRHTVPFWRGLD